MPKTCWAVFKRQAIKLRDWCIWLIYLKLSITFRSEYRHLQKICSILSPRHYGRVDKCNYSRVTMSMNPNIWGFNLLWPPIAVPLFWHFCDWFGWIQMWPRGWWLDFFFGFQPFVITHCSRLHFKCNGTRAETTFRLSAKRKCPFNL
jgi:hypothetical protein